MKTVVTKLGLLARLGMTAAALLLTQQALAAGTDAGTTVSNTATVSYTVGGNTQTPEPSNQADFVVDRRVDFSVTGDGNSEIVNPGDTGLTFDLTLQNDSNDTMDFVVTVEQINPGDPDESVNGGNVDSGADVANVAVVTAYVDDLAEDDSTTISLTGDAALALVNGDIANLRVVVTAYDPAGNAGTPQALSDDSGDADNPATVQNVLADLADGVGGVENGYDGIVVQSAQLVITKSLEVISDPINGVSAVAKAIPGAVIEYTITLDNSAGAVDATAVSITDTVDSDVLFFNTANGGSEPYAGGTGNVEFDGTTVCLADAADANGDGCELDGADLTIAGSDLTGTAITVPLGTTLVVTYRIVIPAT